MIFHRQDKEREQMRLFDRNAVKVIVAGCIVLAVALVIMSITGIMIINKAAVDKLKQDELQMQAENISTMIESRIDKALSTAQLLAHSPVIVDWLRQPDAAGRQAPVVPYVQYLADSMDYDTVFLLQKIPINTGLTMIAILPNWSRFRRRIRRINGFFLFYSGRFLMK